MAFPPGHWYVTEPTKYLVVKCRPRSIVSSNAGLARLLHMFSFQTGTFVYTVSWPHIQPQAVHSRAIACACIMFTNKR